MKNLFDSLHSKAENKDNASHVDIRCERLVKNYDGKSIEISGLNLGGVQLGKFGMEPKLLQTVSHALMLLDASQFDLCNTIKNLKDDEVREKYLRMMTDDKLAAQRIFQALAGLLINPESTLMQEAVKETLMSTLKSRETRAINIENSDLLSRDFQQQSQSERQFPSEEQTREDTTLTHPISIPNTNALEIGNTSFKEKMNDLKKSYIPMSHSSGVNSSTGTTITNRFEPNNMNEEHPLVRELGIIRNEIITLSSEYTASLINGLDIVEFWNNLGQVLRQLTSKREYRKAIGSINAEALDRITIKIAGKIAEFKEADDIGDRNEAIKVKKEVTLYFGQVFRRLDDIYLGIQLKE